MVEHHKKHLSRFCKCGKEMSMNSQGWHCPNDKERPKQYINYSYKKGFKDGKIATLKDLIKFSMDRGYDVGDRIWLKRIIADFKEAKIKEAEG